MSTTEDMKDLKKKIDIAHGHANKQNEEIKAFLTKTEKAWREMRTKDSKSLAALSRSNSDHAIKWEEAKLAREYSIAAVALSVSNANEQNEAIKASFNEHKTWRETWTNEVKSAIAANNLSVSDQATKWQKLDAKLEILIDQEGKEPKSQHENLRCLKVRSP
jgi:hypothetical protein